MGGSDDPPEIVPETGPETVPETVADQVRSLYQAFPYPSADGAARPASAGFPSLLPAINHYLFAGRLFAGGRDFSQPFRVLVAGCGTGDAVIDLGTALAATPAPAEIVAIDLSDASLAIAEERAKAAGLSGVRFLQQPIEDLSSAELGLFDYIDCCGVLHHLEDPAAGLKTLVACLADDGGIGLMLYGALGRSGVYEAQELLGHLLNADRTAPETVAGAREILTALPRTNRLRQNPNFANVERFSDAELADTFLHPMDRAYRVGEIKELLHDAGLDAVEFLPSFRHDPSLMLGPGAALGKARARVAEMDWWSRREVAEMLSGGPKKHALLARRKGPRDGSIAEIEPGMVAVPVDAMLAEIQRLYVPGQASLRLELVVDGDATTVGLQVDDDQGRVLLALDGELTLEAIRGQALPDLSWDAFLEVAERLLRQLTALGVVFLNVKRGSEA